MLLFGTQAQAGAFQYKHSPPLSPSKLWHPNTKFIYIWRFSSDLPVTLPESRVLDLVPTSNYRCMIHMELCVWEDGYDTAAWTPRVSSNCSSYPHSTQLFRSHKCIHRNVQVLEGLAEVEPCKETSEVLTLVYTINMTRIQVVTIECKIKTYTVKKENLGNKMTSYINHVKRNEIGAEDRVLPGMVVHTCNHNPWKVEVIKIRSSKTTSDPQQDGGQPHLHETYKHSACQCLQGNPSAWLVLSKLLEFCWEGG